MDLDTSPASKKRARSSDSSGAEYEGKPLSSSNKPDSEARERKEKKSRRKSRKRRKASVVEGAKPRVEVARSPTLDDDAPAIKRAAGKQPEFVQGSSVAQPDAVALQETADAQKKALDAHDSLLRALLPSLTCQICLDLLHKPFALACGHTACYSCLVSWFTAPPPADHVHELPQFRKKTCPHCRAVVREHPVEVWALKEMVGQLVRSGLAPQFPPPPPPAAPTPGADIWADIFPAPPRAGPGHGLPIPGLGAGGDVHALGMYDAEDGVYRCVDCMHEIWEGSCAQCGRLYPAHDLASGSDSDGEGDVGRLYHALHAGHVHGFHPAPVGAEYWGPDPDGWGSDIEIDGGAGSGGESEESYEGSFIDDGPAPPPPRRGSVISVSSGSDSAAEDAGRQARALGRGLRIGRRAPPPIAADSDDDSDGPRLPPAPRRRGRARAVGVVSDGSADEDMLGVPAEPGSPIYINDEEGSDAPQVVEPRGRVRRRGGYVESGSEGSGAEDGAVHFRAGSISSLEDDDEDDGFISEDKNEDEDGVDSDGGIRRTPRRLQHLMGPGNDEVEFGGSGSDEEEVEGGASGSDDE